MDQAAKRSTEGKENDATQSLSLKVIGQSRAIFEA